MKRQDKEQGAHDRKVRKIARGLKNEGYTVKADIRGYEKPSAIGKHKRRPDIEATSKSGRRKIIEVETPKSLPRDREQTKTFIRHAAQKKNTTLDIIVTKPRTSVKKRK